MKNEKIKPRIIFMGTPDISAQILAALLTNDYDIIGVYTQPDKKVGRKQIIQKSPVKILAEKNNIPAYDPQRLDETETENLRAQKPDLIVLIAYGKILPKAFLEVPKLGAINIHPSLLPKFRGPSPIQSALLEGEKITGTTIMLMDAGMDTGDILQQKQLAINITDTAIELEEKLTKISIQLLLETLPKWIAGELQPQKQDDSKASYCKMIHKSDSQINWNDSAEVIYNKFRAFKDWPGVFTVWNNKRLKLNSIEATMEVSTEYAVGEVFKKEDGSIFIQAGSGAIQLKEVQLEGKSNSQVSNFSNGYKDFIGSILKN